MELCIDTVNIDFNPVYQTGQGHLRCDAIITRAGVLKYFDQLTQAYINVLRHPDEVFDVDSLNTFGGLPITVNHPVDADGNYVMVTPENFDKYGVGVLGDVLTVCNPYVKVSGLNIQSQKGLDALVQGNKQLSPGYLMDRVAENGVFDGIPYTHRQYGISNKEGKSIIQGNHVAIMKGYLGRSGENVKVYGLDSKEEINLITQVECDFTDEKVVKIIDLAPRTTTRKKMKKTIEIKLGKTKYEFVADDDGMMDIPSSDLITIAKVIEQADSLLNQIMEMLGVSDPESIVDAMGNLKASMASKTSPEDAEAMTAENTALKAANGQLEEDKAKMQTAYDSLQLELDKIKAVSEYSEYLPTGLQTDSLTPQEIKREVIKHWDSDFVIPESAIAVDAILPIAIKSLKSKSTESLNKQTNRKATETTVTKALTTDSETVKPGKVKILGLPDRLRKSVV